MRIHVIRCDQCSHEHDVRRALPPEWFVVQHIGGILLGTMEHVVEERHYCSPRCLATSLGVQAPEPRLAGADLTLEGNILWRGQLYIPQEDEAPACLAPTSKMRRFLLVDGETADETEGVQWSDGSVDIKPSLPAYESWDAFKACFAGCGVTWIDQEEVK